MIVTKRPATRVYERYFRYLTFLFPAQLLNLFQSWIIRHSTRATIYCTEYYRRYRLPNIIINLSDSRIFGYYIIRIVEYRDSRIIQPFYRDCIYQLYRRSNNLGFYRISMPFFNPLHCKLYFNFVTNSF